MENDDFLLFFRDKPLSKNALKKLEKEKLKAERKAEKQAQQVGFFTIEMNANILFMFEYTY